MSIMSTHLDEFDVIRANGKDAEAFLQAQLSNDVRELVGPSAQWTALLSPQGRVQALMVLFRLDTEDFALAVPHHQGARILESLRRFVLRRKLQIGLDPELGVIGWSQPIINPDPSMPIIRLDDDRSLSIGVAASAHTEAPAGWQAADFMAGIPWLPEAASDRHLPHALGLERLPAISLKKGCYPGQEIVARTHYLGRNKRQLCLLQSEASNADGYASGVKLRDADGGLAGEIVSVCHAAHQVSALAVMQRERSTATFQLDESTQNHAEMTCVKGF